MWVKQLESSNSRIIKIFSNHSFHEHERFQIGDLMFQDKSRIKVDGGNITIKNLSKEDQGMYECHASNTIVTSVASTILFVQGHDQSQNEIIIGLIN